MDRAIAVCIPADDRAFGERVRLIVSQDRWDFGEAEGVALLEAILRRTYPSATVRAWRVPAGGGRNRTVRVDVYRDGYTSMIARGAASGRATEAVGAYQTALYVDAVSGRRAKDVRD
jgi:hypothetical protein